MTAKYIVLTPVVTGVIDPDGTIGWEFDWSDALEGVYDEEFADVGDGCQLETAVGQLADAWIRGMPSVTRWVVPSDW